jgi:hypothetical protein
MKESIVTSKAEALQLAVVSKSGAIKIVDATKLAELKLKAGDKLRVIKDAKEEAFEDLVVIQKGDNLEIVYADGTSITLEGFYALDNIALELPTSEYEMHMLSSNLQSGTELSIVYAQGDMSAFNAMFESNDAMLQALNNYNTSIDSGLNAAGEAEAAGAAGTAGAEGAAAGAGMFAGVSTGTLVVGGVVVAGAAIAASNSSSSSSSGTGIGSSLKKAFLIDSAVAGVKYTRFIDTDEDGLLDAGETIVATGVTGTDGSFSYATGETVVFEVAGITLGSMSAANINADGKVFPQDILGVERENVTDPDVTKMAQLLQTLDSDGDASNGITIETNEAGDIVTDSGNVIVSSTNFENNITNVLAAVDTSVTYESGASVAVVTPGDAQAHILGTVTGVDDVATITVAAGSVTPYADLADLITDGATSIIVAQTMDLTDLASLVPGIITQEQADAISGYTGSITVNNLNNSSDINLDVTLSQYQAMSINAAGDDTVTVVLADSDATVDPHDDTRMIIDLQDTNLDNADDITLDVTAATDSIETTVSQFLKVTNPLDASVNIEDSVANLTVGNDVDGTTLADATLDNANNVELKLTQDTDLSSVTLVDDVDLIDAEDLDVTLNDTQYTQVITNGNGVRDAVTVTVKDVIANLTGNDYDDANVIVTDAATIAELDAITSTGTITPMIVEGAYADLVDVANAAWFTTNPDIAVTDALTVAELEDIDALTTGDLTYTLADTLENLAGAADGVVSGAISYALTDVTAEVQTLTVDTASSSDGNITVNINGTDYVVAVLSADDAAGVATKIAAIDVSADADIASISATDTVVTITYTEDAGDIADATFTDTGSTNAAVTPATATPYTVGGALTITTLEEAQIIDGATNSGDYSYTIALSLTELVAAEPLPVTYTLSDDAGDISVLTVEEALIVDGATNKADYTYTISDTAENVLADINGDDLVDGLAVAVTLTDTTIAAADLNDINTGITELVTIQATTLTGSTADVKTVFTNGALGQIDGAGDIAITITDAADTVINATDLMYIASLDVADEGTTGVVTIQNGIDISGLYEDVEIVALASNVALSSGVVVNNTFTDTSVSVADLNETDSSPNVGIITATVTYTDIETALTLTDTNSNNVYSIQLVDAEDPTAQQLNDLNGIYTTITSTGTIDVTTVDGDDLRALNLSNADSIVVANGDYVDVTLEQALILDTNTSGQYSITLTGDFDISEYLPAGGVGKLPTGLFDIVLEGTEPQTITIVADATNISVEDIDSDGGEDLFIINGKATDTVIIDASYYGTITTGEADFDEATDTGDYPNDYTKFTNSTTGSSIVVSQAVGNIIISGTFSELDALTTLPDAYILNETPGELSNITVEQAAIVVGANNAGDFTYTISDTAESIAADAATNSGAGTYVTGSINVTLTDSHTLTQLKAINDATSGTITLNDASVALNGTAADVVAALDGIVGYTGTVTLSDSATAEQANAIDTATTGTITADVVAGTANALATGLTDSDTDEDALTLTLTDTGTVAAGDLNTLNDMTSVAVDATGATDITGTVSDLATLKTAMDASEVAIDGDENISVDDAATIDEATAILGYTSGDVNLSTLELVDADDTVALADLVTAGVDSLSIIDAETDVNANAMTITEADVLALGDGLTLDMDGTTDSLSLEETSDVGAWVQGASADGYTTYTYTFTADSSTVDILVKGDGTGVIIA